MEDYIAKRALTPEQAAVRLDDVAVGPEFSVRIIGVASRQGVHTMGELKAALDSGVMERHWKGIGRKSINEIKDYIAHLTRPMGDLFADPDYVRYQLEDKLGSATSIMNDVQRTILGIALRGRATDEQRRHMAFKLRDAADRLLTLPARED
jgi:hypothetical protein